MKYHAIFISIFILTGILVAGPESDYSKYFQDKTMRIDYLHKGNSKNELISLDHIYQYDGWDRSSTHLIDTFNLGEYYYKIYDLLSGKLIFSKGFNNYFSEYVHSAEALSETQKVFHETIIFLFPKEKFRLSFERRDSDNLLKEIFSFEIAPHDSSITHCIPQTQDVVILKSHYSGHPKSKADFVFIGEGYSHVQEDKFKSDLVKFTNTFLNNEPFKSLKDIINIWGILKAGKDSGIDEPRADIFKNTILEATFNSLGMERYIFTENNKSVIDLAMLVPYDAICIIVNHERYGGGGVYNTYCTFTSDNQFNEYLLLHEFGHSFACLADEYYTSANSLSVFYKTDIEPVEPNITTLQNPEALKWKHLITEGIEIPTPWEKQGYDKMDFAWQSIRAKMNDDIAKLKRENADPEIINTAEALYLVQDRGQTEKVITYMKNSKYWGKVGAYEGAGYSSTGIYRPMLDCIMFSKGVKPFCKVCAETIKKKILFCLD